jgi:hypothetical protein
MGSRGRRLSRSSGRRGNLPRRDANGRFIRGAERRRPVRRRAPARARTRPARRTRTVRPRLGSSIVREASERSKAGPALTKRRWYRIDGPVDPSLPEGYTYSR